MTKSKKSTEFMLIKILFNNMKPVNPVHLVLNFLLFKTVKVSIIQNKVIPYSPIYST